MSLCLVTVCHLLNTFSWHLNKLDSCHGLEVIEQRAYSTPSCWIALFSNFDVWWIYLSKKRYLHVKLLYNVEKKLIIQLRLQYMTLLVIISISKIIYIFQIFAIGGLGRVASFPTENNLQKSWYQCANQMSYFIWSMKQVLDLFWYETSMRHNI